MHCWGHEKNLYWVVWKTSMMSSLYVDDKLLINEGNIVCGLFSNPSSYTSRRPSVLDPE